MNIFETRKNLLLSKETGIVSNLDSDNHNPFDLWEYDQKDYLTSNFKLDNKYNIDYLITGDLYSKSKIRDSGFSCWDVAICLSTQPVILNTEYDCVAKSNKNTYWEQLKTKLKNVTCKNKYRELIFNSVYGYDAISNSWWNILDAAHALTHRRINKHIVERKMADTSNLFRHTAVELYFALLYDLPININRTGLLTGEPDFQGGIKLMITSKVENPVLRLPWNGVRAPVIDKTNIVVNTISVFEPVPDAYVLGNEKIDVTYKWCGLPTMFNIVGWEGIDYITHQSIIKSYGNNYEYVIHPLDLISPDYIKEVIDIGKNMGVIKSGDDWVLASDWINSQDCDDLIDSTKCWPCPCCLGFNYASKIRPEQPKGKRPRTITKKDYHWYNFNKEKSFILKLVKNAVEIFLSYLYKSPVQARKYVRSRNKRYENTLKQIKHYYNLEKALKKDKEGKFLGERDRKLIKEYRLSKRDK